ncbi:hypothetical protein E0198_004945 [Clavispora lusitaniae]|nr:hypothetical protein E0198_004945 [Clavispora lusitaniae]
MQLSSLALALLCTGHTLAHGKPAPKPADLTWEQWHMKEEHEMDEFDPSSFFLLHDLENKGYWTETDILYVYGLTRDSVVGDGSGMGEHDHNEQISKEDKDKVVRTVLKMVDSDHDGQVSREEWMDFSKSNQLPDFGFGPGHHMDFEAEYENHHWNKYHRDQDPDVHVKHKEDIEHELLHHLHEIDETHDKDANARKLSKNFASPVHVANVPQKYLAK